MCFAKKCIPDPSTHWRMSSGKPEQNYLHIGIYWRSLIELKKVEPKKEFFKPRKDFPAAVSNFKKGGENNSSAGAPFSGFKKSGSASSRGDDLKDVECFKCHKKGHYANKCPEIKVKDGKPPVKVRKMDDSGPKSDPEAKSVRQIRIRYSDIEAQIRTHL